MELHTHSHTYCHVRLNPVTHCHMLLHDATTATYDHSAPRSYPRHGYIPLRTHAAGGLCTHWEGRRYHPSPRGQDRRPNQHLACDVPSHALLLPRAITSRDTPLRAVVYRCILLHGAGVRINIERASEMGADARCRAIFIEGGEAARNRCEQVLRDEPLYAAASCHTATCCHILLHIAAYCTVLHTAACSQVHVLPAVAGAAGARGAPTGGL